jgi:hypothetical protein
MPKIIDPFPAPPHDLDGEHTAALRTLTERALRNQRREVARSIDAAFDHIPRTMRPVVRRVLGL